MASTFLKSIHNWIYIHICGKSAGNQHREFHLVSAKLPKLQALFTLSQWDLLELQLHLSFPTAPAAAKPPGLACQERWEAWPSIPHPPHSLPLHHSSDPADALLPLFPLILTVRSWCTTTGHTSLPRPSHRVGFHQFSWRWGSGIDWKQSRIFWKRATIMGKRTTEALLPDVCSWENRACGFWCLQNSFLKNRTWIFLLAQQCGSRKALKGTWEHNLKRGGWREKRLYPLPLKIIWTRILA